MEAVYISLKATSRQDGTMFVTSPNAPYFSIVVADQDWNAVLPFLKDSLTVNVGPVQSVRFLEDAANFVPDDAPTHAMPPAHVIAEVAPERARLR